jgi:hypothetical protein
MFSPYGSPFANANRLNPHYYTALVFICQCESIRFYEITCYNPMMSGTIFNRQQCMAFNSSSK